MRKTEQANRKTIEPPRPLSLVAMACSLMSLVLLGLVGRGLFNATPISLYAVACAVFAFAGIVLGVLAYQRGSDKTVPKVAIILAALILVLLVVFVFVVGRMLLRAV